MISLSIYAARMLEAEFDNPADEKKTLDYVLTWVNGRPAEITRPAEGLIHARLLEPKASV